ncbi:MAG: 2-aminoethylphosphonate--pyruvate transaminase [Bacteroidia bacterium]|nr:2-aminoethylphosphonate--pyruvate transaminase [Bacteroidia bacterium]
MDDAKLFTPGPLTTHREVRAAMNRDLGSRDDDFVRLTRRVRQSLLDLYDLNDDYAAVLLPGSGTYAVEAVLGLVHGKVLIVNNGAYGARMTQIAQSLRIPYVEMVYDETVAPNPAEVQRMILKYGSITHLAFVHCETTTGMFNPFDELAALGREHGVCVVVDVMSSFGAVDFKADTADFLIFSSNKCLEGPPGLAVVLARKSWLESAVGRGFSLNLAAQWKYMEHTGQFRFTPPVQIVCALDSALNRLQAEGGVKRRAERYIQNYLTLLYEMRRMGFRELLDSRLQGYIITSFRFPEHPVFDFDVFYRMLKERGKIIYPGKVSGAESFRIGHIGDLYPSDMRELARAIEDALAQMGVALPLC